MNVFYDIYKLMEQILSKVQDVNETRVKSTDINSRRWIFPTIPTSQDDSYPRISVQLSNVEEEAVSAGSYISDNFNSLDNIKKQSTGKVYTVTVWVGLYVKRELPGLIDFPDGSVKKAKNTLLGNLLYDKLLKTIDSSRDDINKVAFNYLPYKKEITLGYDDSSNRIVYETSINISILSETEQVFDENQLINLINQTYNIT